MSLPQVLQRLNEFDVDKVIVRVEVQLECGSSCVRIKHEEVAPAAFGEGATGTVSEGVLQCQGHQLGMWRREDWHLVRFFFPFYWMCMGVLFNFIYYYYYY